ncbi:VOC family protein [Alkalicoccobacillus murimartini]|uniref:Catechol 2,3-dioxygenase-like lactoylglutathione lyase family enzyme n=1 Tax=Alkalicoccobacillus murimartini TaxID=171685 RepID=A0ABT9YIB1_9BACI|nr:VOC family protein [Alkalicoccobacillus murimartini]MDQ0207343.1 catechol 2,3-dioxygenase-like lactoylglutathione lyase family enzyme [Alkalicoccobacillus murimartini]
MNFLRLDHFVLTVKSIEASCIFYQEVLGMEIEVFGEGRKAAKFGQQKINFHQVGQEIDPKAKSPMSGSGDICLITNESQESTMEHLKQQNVEIELGPVKRTGALGPIQSIYIRDPDENLIEISRYESNT